MWYQKMLPERGSVNCAHGASHCVIEAADRSTAHKCFFFGPFASPAVSPPPARNRQPPSPAASAAATSASLMTVPPSGVSHVLSPVAQL